MSQENVDIVFDDKGTPQKTAANVDRLGSSLERVANQFDKATGATTKNAGANDRAATSASGASRGFGLLSGAIATLTAGFSLSKVMEYADSYTNLQNRLRLVTKDTAALNSATAEVGRIALASRTSFDATGGVYVRVSEALRSMNKDAKLAGPLTETISKAVAMSGVSAETAANGLRQFEQALGSGVLRGEEFNSVMENAPGLARALAEGLRVPVGALRAMAENGELTANKLISALGTAGPKVAAAFAQSVPTISQAFQNINTAITMYIGQANTAGGFSTMLANAMLSIANNINVVIPVVVALGVALAALAIGTVVSALYSMAVGFTALVVAAAPFLPIIAAIGVALTAGALLVRNYGAALYEWAVNLPIVGAGLKTLLDTMAPLAAAVGLTASKTREAAAAEADRAKGIGDLSKGTAVAANENKNLHATFGNLTGSTAAATSGTKTLSAALAELRGNADAARVSINNYGEKLKTIAEQTEYWKEVNEKQRAKLQALTDAILKTGNSTRELASAQNEAALAFEVTIDLIDNQASSLENLASAAGSASSAMKSVNSGSGKSPMGTSMGGMFDREMTLGNLTSMTGGVMTPTLQAISENLRNHFASETMRALDAGVPRDAIPTYNLGTTASAFTRQIDAAINRHKLSGADSASKGSTVAAAPVAPVSTASPSNPKAGPVTGTVSTGGGTSITIVTRDLDSFRRSEQQILQDLARRLGKAVA